MVLNAKSYEITDNFAVISVCRFGPGGDYRRDWPGNPETQRQNPAGLSVQTGRFFGWLALRLHTTLRLILGKNTENKQKQTKTDKSEGIADRLLPAYTDVFRALKNWGVENEANAKIKKASRPDRPGNDSRAVQFTQKPPDPDIEADPGAQADSKVPAEKWLFPDDGRIGRHSSIKQSHRLRTRRYTGKKRRSAPAAKEVTLFDC